MNNKDTEVQTRFSLRSMEDIEKVLEHVSNEVLAGKMTGRTADTVNTAVKTYLACHRLQFQYRKQMLDFHKAQINAGKLSQDDVIRKADRLGIPSAAK